MDAGNYRLIIEPEKKEEPRNRHWLILLELVLVIPAAMVLVLLIVALLRGA